MTTTLTRARIVAALARADAATIEGFPGYLVTRDGRVLSTSSNWRGYGERELRPTLDGGGYYRVRMIANDGKRHSRRIHSLVAAAFLPPRPFGHEVRHLDGDKSNNSIDNLAWGTPKQNAADRDAHGTTARGERNGMARLTEDAVRKVRQLRAAGYLYREIEEVTGVSRLHAQKIATGKAWAHIMPCATVRAVTGDDERSTT